MKSVVISVVSYLLILAPATSLAQSCECVTEGRSLWQARSGFAVDCPDFKQANCHPINGRWFCSSGRISGQSIPINSCGASLQISPPQPAVLLPLAEENLSGTPGVSEPSPGACSVVALSLRESRESFGRACGMTYDQDRGHDCENISGLWACGDRNLRGISSLSEVPGLRGSESSNTESQSAPVESSQASVSLPNRSLLRAGQSYHLQLQGRINENLPVDVYVFDLEDNASSGVIDRLKNKGKTVICYFSAGTFEDWRSDKGRWNSSDMGNKLGEWPGERWADVRSENVRNIMRSRMDRAKAAGCHGVDPDNLDGYSNNNGLGLTADDQLNYLSFLADYAHSIGLKIGLKNTVGLINRANLASQFDFTVNEQCFQYNECSVLSNFINQNKPVFIIEYNQSNRAAKCSDATNRNFSLRFADLSLNGQKFESCQ